MAVDLSTKKRSKRSLFRVFFPFGDCRDSLLRQFLQPIVLIQKGLAGTGVNVDPRFGATLEE
eukprot:scaffold289887_cov13-Prasinocladus_malaysianus.AAC.1